MKKTIISLALALTLVLSIAIPAMAVPDVTTNVTVSTSTGGGNPIIKAKWETKYVIGQPGNVDDDTTTPGLQLMPTAAYRYVTPMKFYAIVTDPQGPLTINSVWVDVFHPGPEDGDVEPPDPVWPENGSFKFQVQLYPLNNALADGVIDATDAQNAIDKFNWACEDDLVTINVDEQTPEGKDITEAEIIEELSQGDAYLWVGEYYMYYHQPYGRYKVEAYAFDKVTNNQSQRLINYFDWLELCAFEIDFSVVDYGEAVVCEETVAPGDIDFSTPGYPSVRNIGNTWLQLGVRQDDMGFAQSVGGAWNVTYDARLGSLLEGNDKVLYNPAYVKGATPSGAYTTIPGVIHLCNTWKLDFSIHVIKALADAPGYPDFSGVLTLNCTKVDFTGPNVPHPGVGDTEPPPYP